MSVRGCFQFIGTAAIVFLTALVPVGFGASQSEDPGPYLDSYSEMIGLVHRAYFKPAPVAPLITDSLYGLSDALDPLSIFIPADQVKTTLEARDLDARTSGVLILVQRGVVYVAGVAQDSPADRAGLQVGDILSEIDGRATHGLAGWLAIQLFSKPPGDRLQLDVLRRGEPHQATLEFGLFEFPVAEHLELEGESILRLTQFSAATVDQLEGFLANLSGRGVRRVLLDLRGASWGSCEAAFEVADLFAGESLGFRVRRGKVLESFSGREGADWQGKVVVLVDRGTMGPGELLAAILKDKLGAELVGESTFGLAGHQEVLRLSDGAALVLTTSFYAGPNGKPLNQPVPPDVRVRPEPFADSDQDTILEAGLRRLAKEGRE